MWNRGFKAGSLSVVPRKARVITGWRAKTPGGTKEANASAVRKGALPPELASRGGFVTPESDLIS